MAKVAIGSAANALAAMNMINRCLTAMSVPYSGVPLLQRSYAEAPIGTAGVVLGWKDYLDADTAAAQWDFWAVLGSQVVVKNLADGILYKVLKDQSLTWFYTTEKTRFETLNTAGKTWLPDYWPYDAYNVMAIREYTLLQTAGTRHTRDSHPDFSWGNFTSQMGNDLADIRASGMRYGVAECAADSGGNVRLIDGSSGLHSDTLPV